MTFNNVVLSKSQGSLASAKATSEDEEAQGSNFTKSLTLDMLDVELLALLEVGEMNGYQLRKRLRIYFQTDSSFGTVYPHLKRLSQARLVVGELVTVPRKGGKSDNWSRKETRVFRLTDKGRNALKYNYQKLLKVIILVQVNSKHSSE